MKQITVPLLFFILSFYCFGLGMMDSFVVYHSWLYVGANEFAAMHSAASERIVPLLVLPTLVLTILCVIMLQNRPAYFTKRQIGLALLMLMSGWLSSALIQIPIQNQLQTGKDDALIQKLIVTDWIRVIAWFGYIIIVLKMLLQVMAGFNVNAAGQTDARKSKTKY